MSPSALPEVRFVLRHSSTEDLEALCARVVAGGDPSLTRRLLQEFAASKLKSR